MNIKEIGELVVNSFYNSLHECSLAYGYDNGTLTQKEKDTYIELLRAKVDRLEKENAQQSAMISKYITGGK